MLLFTMILMSKKFGVKNSNDLTQFQTSSAPAWRAGRSDGRPGLGLWKDDDLGTWWFNPLRQAGYNMLKHVKTAQLQTLPLLTPLLRWTRPLHEVRWTTKYGDANKSFQNRSKAKSMINPKSFGFISFATLQEFTVFIQRGLKHSDETLQWPVSCWQKFWRLSVKEVTCHNWLLSLIPIFWWLVSILNSQ